MQRSAPIPLRTGRRNPRVPTCPEYDQDDLALPIGIRKVIGQLQGGKQTVQLKEALNAARPLGS